MASAKVYGMDGAEQRTIDLNDAVFGAEANEGVVKEAVVALQAARHQGTHKAKVRREVSGGGVKPFRQKGTGRARQGSSREPHMRGGGVIFGPRPRSYRQKVPTAIRRKALCCALSARLRGEMLGVVAGLKVEAPKTKIMADMLGKVAPEGRKTLVVLAGPDQNALLSARNIQCVTLRTASDLNVLDVLAARRVIIQEEAIAKLEERLT